MGHSYGINEYAMKLLTWNLHSRPKHNQPPSFETLNDTIDFLDHHAASDLVIRYMQETPIAGVELKKHVEGVSPWLHHEKITLEHPEARGGACALFRSSLDELIDPSYPVVILGDFNAEPRSHEITSPFCFYARTDRDRVIGSKKNITDKIRRPIFEKSPMAMEPTSQFNRVISDLSEALRN